MVESNPYDDIKLRCVYMHPFMCSVFDIFDICLCEKHHTVLTCPFWMEHEPWLACLVSCIQPPGSRPCWPSSAWRAQEHRSRSPWDGAHGWSTHDCWPPRGCCVRPTQLKHALARM